MTLGAPEPTRDQRRLLAAGWTVVKRATVIGMPFVWWTHERYHPMLEDKAVQLLGVREKEAGRKAGRRAHEYNY